MQILIVRTRYYWWIQGIVGLIAVLFGLVALIWPHLTLTVLVLLFGVFALLYGIFTVVIALIERGVFGRWWVTLLEGLLSIAVGVLTFFWIGITTLVLLYLIATWAIVTGILKIITAILRWNRGRNEWLLLLSGIVSFLFGVIVLFQPHAGAIALIWAIGVYAIALGVFLLIRAFSLRSLMAASTRELP